MVDCGWQLGVTLCIFRSDRPRLAGMTIYADLLAEMLVIALRVKFRTGQNQLQRSHCVGSVNHRREASAIVDRSGVRALRQQ